MQLAVSKSTIPLSRWKSALVGQIVTHGALSQWLQRITAKCRLTSGNEPDSMYFTHVRLTPSGTSCSALHATVHAWQPMHVSWSIRNPYRVMWLVVLPPSCRRG